MKSAEEYRKQFNLSDESADELWSRCDDIDAAINEARKELLNEFANYVSTWDYEQEMEFNENGGHEELWRNKINELQ